MLSVSHRKQEEVHDHYDHDDHVDDVLPNTLKKGITDTDADSGSVV